MLGNIVLEKNEKVEEIENAANNVYEDLSDNDSFFNRIYNPNVREIRKGFYDVEYIVLYNDGILDIDFN